VIVTELRARTAVAAVLLAAAVLAVPAAAGGATPACSEVTALQLVNDHRLNDFLLDDPVAQVLCGAFAGPGSETMAVTLAAGTCWPVQRWVVFDFVGGGWKLVLDRSAFLSAPLAAAGGDIRETTPVFRSSDPRCVPTGGTRARTWHWNGARFTASAWKQVTPGKRVARTAVVFAPAPASVSCAMTDDGTARGSRVYCWVGRDRGATPRVTMGPDGRLDRKTRHALPPGLGGPSLAYGSSVTLGRFRCTSRRSGLRCVVIRSRKGFVFNAKGATRVRP
jgi:hypothetical protein